jgi:hypothetical protein
LPALNYSLKPVIDGLPGEQKAQSGRLERATGNSVEFIGEFFLRNGRGNPRKAKMAGKKDAKLKASQWDRAEKTKEKSAGDPEKELKGDPSEQGKPKKRISPQRGKEEAEASGEASQTKRRQVRKVATMVKRLKRSREEPGQQCKAEAEQGQAADGGWDARQQETVEAYARARGMEPREVLQALVNSMEKTPRKERVEDLAEQAPSPKANQPNESGGKPEAKVRQEGERKGEKEKSMEAKYIACCKGKRKGIPPKARWKEEQKEKVQGMKELQERGLEDGARNNGVTLDAEGKENRVKAVSNSEETVNGVAHGSEKACSVFEGLKGGTEILGGAAPKAPVACVSGTLRDLAHAGAVQRVAPAGGSGSGSGPRSISLSEINQQVLRSEYKLKEGYLQQRVPTLHEEHTLYEILTM